MSYSRENYNRVMDEFHEKKRVVEEAAEQRTEALHEKFPEIKEIDQKISSLSFRLFAESAKGLNGLKERINAIRVDTDKQLARRAEILAVAGLPEDYDAPQYNCKKCEDNGFDKKGIMCECFRKALNIAGFESSGMAKLISKQNFDNFSLSYYHDQDLAKMKNNLAKAQEYAENFFGKEANNLLFLGTTGLGKTHLSSAIAQSVIAKGYDVVYESASNIFSAFEKERFSRQNSGEKSETDRFFDCDLLIIDDLGTEVSNQFTVSCLYNLLNTRIVNDKSMIISTNVTKEDLLDRYSDRILSRLFGEFSILLFTGVDIRSQKLRK